jgi:hypothetical protein
MWKAQYSLSERLFWAFHISEGTVFKLSNLSFAYLHRFSHVISFCLYLYREAQRKITAGLYIGEGSENRLSRFSTHSLGLPASSWDLKSGRVCFQTLVLCRSCYFSKFLVFVFLIMFLQKRTSSLSMWRFYIEGLSDLRSLRPVDLPQPTSLGDLKPERPSNMGHSEPAPTSTPWRMNGTWSGNSFLVGLQLPN